MLMTVMGHGLPDVQMRQGTNKLWFHVSRQYIVNSLRVRRNALEFAVSRR